MMMGGMIYPFSEWATPLPELKKRLGYQDDTTAAVKEAKALMSAAGLGNGAKGLDFLVRDVASFKLWAQAIQAMLQQIGVECTLRTVVESVWFDDIKTGKFDLAIGAIVSTLLDPSDYFNAWYKKDGPQNYGWWDNAKFNALLPQITGLGLQLGSIFSGALILEVVFGYPGMGTLMFQAVMGNDYSLIMGIAIFSIVGVATSILVLDLIYPLFDPRVRHQ